MAGPSRQERASPGGHPASAAPRYREVQGVRIPSLIYGTAWKEEATAPLTRLALEAGFRGIDTANQRRHYFESGVGEAIGSAIREGRLARDDLFLQTKFTFAEGQGSMLPYDSRASPTAQVDQSFASSLEHLGVERLDAYLLHGPSRREGLAERDWETWRAMEALQRNGQTRLIGVSNVTSRQLEELHRGATVKPSLVQNRCFARPRADREVRAFCREHGILYEGFSLLTGSGGLLTHPTLEAIAARVQRTPAAVVFRFALDWGMVALTGTTSRRHMDEDLGVFEFALEAAEIQAIEGLVGN
jgi:diketogulonate reductase-like aldo/keto reductase